MAFKNGWWLTDGCGAWVLLAGEGDGLIAAPFATVAWPCGVSRGRAARAAAPAIAPTAASAASAPVAVWRGRADLLFLELTLVSSRCGGWGRRRLRRRRQRPD